MPERLQIVEHPLTTQLLTAEPDKAFLEAILRVSYSLGTATNDVSSQSSEDMLVLTVPRGGLLVGKALSRAIPDGHQALVNDGTSRVPDRPLLPPDLQVRKRVLIADGISATGSTLKRVVEGVKNKSIAQGVKPEYTLVAPVIAANGVYGVDTLLDWAKREKIDLHIVTAHVEEQVEYVTFDLNDGGKKTVMIVGKVYRDAEGKFVGCQIGDYGDMTMALMEKDYYEAMVVAVLASLSS